MFVFKIISSLTLFVFLHSSGVRGEGRLLEPVARATAWRLGANTHRNYDDHSLNCGGETYHESERSFQCGACGDVFHLPVPRPNENGGKYSRDLTGNVYIARKYVQGQTIRIRFELTANYGGDAKFAICHLHSDDEVESEECFNKHPLKLEYVPENNDSCLDQPFKDKINVCRGKNNYEVNAKLPKDLQCERCVLRWNYKSAKNWGFCPDGVGRLGCGREEIFRGCSDISISATSKTPSSAVGPGLTFPSTYFLAILISILLIAIS